MSSRRLWTLRSGVALALLAGGVAMVAARFIEQEQLAPAVSYVELDGSQHHSDELRGRVVLVNFWATTCTQCIREMPKLVALHEKLAAKGYQTLAVAMSYDPPAYVVNYAQSRQLPFPVVIDNTGAIAQAYGKVRLTPTSFLIDRDGHIVERFVGEPDFDQLEARIEQLLRPAAT
jgi:peroxiredoxin